MKYYDFVKYKSSDRFAKKVASYCIKNKVDAVVVYDDTSPLCAEIIKKNAPQIKIIMDMSAPSLPYLSSIYKKDMEITPLFAQQLKNERKNALDIALLQRSKREIESADYFITASEFSKKSVVACGKDANKVYVCPYGINSELFTPGFDRDGTILHAVYVGGTKQFKGISYLLDAFRILKDLPIDLTVVGANTLKAELTKNLVNVKFTGIIMPDEVAQILRKSDFMIFPSLGDGFGFAVAEALAAGCPVICSENAGAVDLISDGNNGFRIRAQDTDGIVNKVKYFIENREELSMMQVKARKSVLNLSWENYYINIGDIVQSICENQENN